VFLINRHQKETDMATVLTTVSMPEEITKVLKDYCKENGHSVSWAVTTAVKMFLNSRGVSLNNDPPK
jgi:hypothetical protein